VPIDGLDGLSNGLEGGIVADPFKGVTYEVRQPPASRPSGLGSTHPAEFLLEPPGRGGEEVSGFQLGQGLDLLWREAAFLGLEDSSPGGIGQLHQLGLGLADIINRVGKFPHNVEPIDGDGGILEVLADGGQERLGHVAHHLDDVARLAAMLFEEFLEGGVAKLVENWKIGVSS
jgi:hypothetical protein